jgi:hypothetical protein
VTLKILNTNAGIEPTKQDKNREITFNGQYARRRVSQFKASDGHGQKRFTSLNQTACRHASDRQRLLLIGG